MGRMRCDIRVLTWTLCLAACPAVWAGPAAGDESPTARWIAAGRAQAMQWIWPEGVHVLGHRCHVSPGRRKFGYRLEVADPAQVKSAVLKVASFSPFTASVNGVMVGQGGPSTTFTAFDVTAELKGGVNVLELATVHDGQRGRGAGVAGELVLEYRDGRRRRVVTDRRWRAATAAEPWRPARELGDADCNPWQEQAGATAGRPLPLFRKTFRLDGRPIDAARVRVCGLGHFELSVNGRKVGDHVLDPPWSDYHKTCYTVDFDVTDLLRPGENVLGVMLGNGMYNVRGGRYVKFIGSCGRPMLWLRLEVDQGRRKVCIVSDDSWKTAEGPIRFSCIYGGEDYDARREQPGWDRPGFDDRGWRPAVVVAGPGGRLMQAVSPPVRVVRRLEARSITKLPDGRYEVDLGENLSARPRLTVKGRRGSRVTVQTAEVRGKPWPGHSYTYILKGGSRPETFVPRFTYFGFQYLYLDGVVAAGEKAGGDDRPELVEVGADFISSCGRPVGAFACSHGLFNQIQAMINRSVASNLQHVLTDCPHREKLGWLEVSHLMGPSILFHYDVGDLYRKICRDTTDSQLENGLVPDIAPEYVRFIGGYFESPEWGSAAVQIPWLLYRWYGDRDILRRQYETMASYTRYLAATRNRAGLVKGGLGDWFDWTAQKGHRGPSQLTPAELPATCMLYDNARILHRTATLLGKPEQARHWEELAGQVRRDFQAAYYDRQHKTVATSSQAALAMGLYFDLVPARDRQAVLLGLVKKLEACKYRQSTGEVAFRYLVLALARAGRSDVVYRMIDRTDAPGYGCMLKQYGLKTLSERWDRPGSSLNHCMFGHIQEWFYKYLLGIRQVPGGTGYRRVLIDPFIPESLAWARGHFDSPAGRIEVAWEKQGRTVQVIVRSEGPQVLVPPDRKDIRWKIETCRQDQPAPADGAETVEEGGPVEPSLRRVR